MLYPFINEEITIYSSNIDSKFSVLIPGMQLSPTTSYKMPSG